MSMMGVRTGRARRLARDWVRSELHVAAAGLALLMGSEAARAHGWYRETWCSAKLARSRLHRHRREARARR